MSTSIMNKEQKQLHRTLVKLTGATKKHEPFECGKRIPTNRLHLKGYNISIIEVWSNAVWYLCNFHDGEHIIATGASLTSEEIKQVYDIINDREQ